jgi:hypothetical protein
MKTKIVSFATPGYVPQLIKLKGDCEAFGLPHDLKVLTKSFQAWTKAVHWKLDFITEKLQEHGVIAWLDADCRIRKYPILFETLEKNGRTDMSFYTPMHKRPPSVNTMQSVNSAVMWMRNTTRTKAFLDHWKQKRQSSRGIDPALYHTCLKIGADIHWIRLPQCYVKFNWRGWDIGESNDPIIEDKSCVDRDRRLRRRQRAKRHRVEEA